MKSKEVIEYTEMLELMDSIFGVLEIFESEVKTAQWFTLKNPHLGESRPIDFFLVGRGHKVLKFIKSRMEELDGVEE